jgi:hypothetical protein
VHDLDAVNTVAVTLTLVADLLLVALILVGIAALVGHRGRKLASHAVSCVGPWVHIAALVVAATAMAGSLYYSEVLGLRPCTLCWDQRICMYSLALILGLGVLRRDRGVFWYAFPLALIGAGIALNHLLEEGSAQPLAFMSFSAFLLIAGLLAIGFTRDRPRWATPSTPERQHLDGGEASPLTAGRQRRRALRRQDFGAELGFFTQNDLERGLDAGGVEVRFRRRI